MPYIDKQPCKLAWVLALDACSPHEIIHEIDDFPLYYDACYLPEVHKNCFETAETDKSWLPTELDNHKKYCKTCVGSNIHVQAEVNNQNI